MSLFGTSEEGEGLEEEGGGDHSKYGRTFSQAIHIPIISASFEEMFHFYVKVKGLD